LTGVEDQSWQRLDKFLFYARFCRTRAIAASLIAGGLVRINRQPTEKPGARVRIGDVLTMPLPQSVKVVEVIGLATRRGTAPQAQQLYREVL
jgi:ribosome-associated heat shock protein Hsp15